MNNITNLILESREAQQNHAKIMTKTLHRIEIVQPNAPPTSGQWNSHALSANTLHNPKAAKDAIKEAMPHMGALPVCQGKRQQQFIKSKTSNLAEGMGVFFLLCLPARQACEADGPYNMDPYPAGRDFKMVYLLLNLRIISSVYINHFEMPTNLCYMRPALASGSASLRGVGSCLYEPEASP